MHIAKLKHIISYDKRKTMGLYKMTYWNMVVIHKGKNTTNLNYNVLISNINAWIIAQ